MTKMRASAFVYWILVFQSILILFIVHALDRHRQVGNQRDTEDFDVVVNPKSSSRFLHPSLTTNFLLRSKRDGEVERETIATRHAKRRKRRRCRNRTTCLRGTFAVQKANETKEDRHVNNTVLESGEEQRERSGMIPRVQEVYNESKGEDYEFGDSDEERGKTEGYEKTFAVPNRKNTFVSDDLPDSELIDSYDDLSPSDRGEFGIDRSNKDKLYMDDIHPSILYSAIDDQITMHESLSVLLSKLFQSLRNASATSNQDIFKELNIMNGTNEDPCQKWLNSKDKLEQVFLGGLASLPACPCQYPSNIFYDDKIWDERHKRYFRWRDVSGDSQRLDVYKLGATYCVRSLLMQGSGSAAAQHCCYDRRRKLLTRGSGAGTPNFVSPEISPILHERIDVLPWRLCKGDFSRYNGVRPPNNDNACEANPDDEEYQRQIDHTKYY